MGEPQYIPAIEALTPDEESWSRSSLRKMQYKNGERMPPCRIPCLIRKEDDCCPLQRTQLEEDEYQLLIACHK